MSAKMDRPIPTKEPWPFRVTTPRLATALLGFLFAGHLAVNLLVQDKHLLTQISTIVLFVQKLLGVAVMFYAARLTARSKPAYAAPWYLWMIGFLFSGLGDLTWIILDMVLHQSPFPSLADLFYLLFYVLVGLGMVKYPMEEHRAGEQKFALLDNIIVVLGAGLGFWYLLIGSHLFFGDQDAVASLLALAYPILDIFMLWYILIFFRNHSQQSAYTPLLMMGLGSLFAIGADVLFAYATVHNGAVPDIWMDMGWMASFLVMTLAGIQQGKILLVEHDGSDTPRRARHPRFSSTWPVYLPYFWLIIAYVILSTALSIKPDHLSLYLMVGLIIALVITRQVLTLNENERLFHQAQAELDERKQAQESLRQANLALDERVRRRTDELQTANNLLVQSNKKLERSLHEKEVLIKEIHHRVKNNLQTVSSLLSLQAQLIQDPAARSAFEESRMRVQSMALIHEKLYQSENLSEINLHPYVENLAAILFRSYQAQTGQVQLVTQVEDILVGIDTAIPIGLILNELISNALKHAFPDGRSGKIQITLLRESPKRIAITCQDDGVGLPGDLEIRTNASLGLQLVNSLVHQLNGVLTVSSTTGAQFTISIPADTASPAEADTPATSGAAGEQG